MIVSDGLALLVTLIFAAAGILLLWRISTPSNNPDQEYWRKITISSVQEYWWWFILSTVIIGLMFLAKG